MSVINEIKEFTTEIDKILNIAYEKRQELIKWCYLNKERVKSIYPIKDTIYEIINPGKALDGFFKDSDVKFRFREKYYSLKNKYYFKVTDIDFDFDNEFHGWMGEETKMPFVKGVVLDSNHDRITPSYVFDDIEITHLKEINKEDLLKEKCSKNKKTFIYVMIDKNTGYYKIGKSINPKYRERTLQSEKPTIEMLHVFSGKSSDEKKLHEIFKQKRIRGEWFDLSGSDVQLINTYFIEKTD